MTLRYGYVDPHYIEGGKHHISAKCGIRLKKAESSKLKKLQKHTSKKRIIKMAFKLQSDKKESENKTIRFPLDVVESRPLNRQ